MRTQRWCRYPVPLKNGGVNVFSSSATLNPIEGEALVTTKLADRHRGVGQAKNGAGIGGHEPRLVLDHHHANALALELEQGIAPRIGGGGVGVQEGPQTAPRCPARVLCWP